MRRLLVAACLAAGCAAPGASGRTKLVSISENLRAPDGVVARGTGWSVRKTTLHGGSQEGVELVRVDTGALRFDVIPTRGMSVRRVNAGDVRLGWDSPVKQVVHPRHVDLQDHGGLGWLTGFNEWMVRCGVAFAGHPGEDNGRLLTLHGRIGNIPASEVEVVVDDRIRVRGLVEERMFKFGIFELWTEISTEPGSRTIRIEDRLVNRSAYAQEYQVIYHSNYGPPLLEKGSKVVAPVKEIFPFDAYAAKDLATYETYLGPTKDYGEQVYCIRPHADDRGFTTVVLHDAAGTRGVAVRYDTSTLPAFTLWKNTDTLADGYVTGLEPGTGYPYNRSVERKAGRVPKLEAGGEVRFRVEVTVLPDRAAVAAAKKTVAALQSRGAPKVVAEPPAHE